MTGQLQWPARSSGRPAPNVYPMGKNLKVAGYWIKSQIWSSGQPPSISTSSVSLREKLLIPEESFFLGSLLVWAASLWETQGLRKRPDWLATGSSGWPLDQRQNFDPVASHPQKTGTTWDSRMKHTSPESLFQELSGDVCFILLSHVVPEQNGKECAAETAEMSRWLATGSLLYWM